MATATPNATGWGNTVKLEGSLDAFSLPDIFQLLSFTKKSGGLHLRRAATHGCVHFRDGAVTGATSDDGRQALARRILFARAWAREPELALLDEPFAGLDRATRADLTRRLNEWLAEGGSCVIATPPPTVFHGWMIA